MNNKRSYIINYSGTLKINSAKAAHQFVTHFRPKIQIKVLACKFSWSFSIYFQFFLFVTSFLNNLLLFFCFFRIFIQFCYSIFYKCVLLSPIWQNIKYVTEFVESSFVCKKCFESNYIEGSQYVIARIYDGSNFVLNLYITIFFLSLELVKNYLKLIQKSKHKVKIE